jgi:hypothetical protein
VQDEIICRRTEVRAAPSEYKTEWKRVEEKEKLPIQEGIEAYIFAFQDLLQVCNSYRHWNRSSSIV